VPINKRNKTIDRIIMNDYNSIRKETKERFKNRVEKDSYDRAIKKIRTCFNTTFVGAISKIEEGFGDLWGEHDNEEIDEDKMTDEQLKYYDIFLAMRDEIFDQGNKQMKIAIEEAKRLYKVGKNN
jgi:hypothetical protein